MAFKRKSPKKGIFRPKNPEKYKGNPTTIVFRSSWELMYMAYLDKHPQVLSWSSEETTVRYRCPITNRLRRYFPDFRVTFRNKDGIVETRIIEIKPLSQTQPPKRKSKYFAEHMKTYSVNQAKWAACRVFCENRNFTFQVLTEIDLGLKK